MVTEMIRASVAPEDLCGYGKTFQEKKTYLQHSTNQAFLVEWSDRNISSVLPDTTFLLDFAKRHHKHLQRITNKILWYDETRLK